MATYYVKFGNEKRRLWEDAKRYGFVSAGGGSRWSKPLGRLDVGDEVLVHVPGHGYAGVGRVVESCQPIRNVKVEVDGVMTPLLEAPLQSPRLDIAADNDAECEWVVRVEWTKAVPKREAYWRT